MAERPHVDGRAAVAEVAAASVAIGLLLIAAVGAAAVALAGRAETVDTIVYASSFLVALPAAVTLGSYAADRMSEGARRIATVLAGAAGGILALLFLPRDLLASARLPLALLLAVAGAAAWLFVRRLGLGRRLRWALDAAAVVLILLLASDVAVLNGPGSGNPAELRFVLLHHDAFLGPVNDMLNGRPLLVDTFSAYGVGVFYFLALFFQVAPLGYGAFGVLVGALTALQHALVYVTLRLTGCSPLLACAGLAGALLAGVFALFASPALLPSAGFLRYWPGYAMVAATVVRSRGRPRPGLASAAEAIVLAAASIWSFDALLYAGAVLAGAAGLDAVLDADRARQRARLFASRLAAPLAACLVVHLFLAVATRAFAGAWPDWPGLIAMLDDYFDEQGFWFVQADPMSPGVLLGLALFASGVGAVALLARRPDIARAERTTLCALVGFTMLGAVTLSYYVGRSLDSTVPALLLPAVACGVLWTTLVAEKASGLSLRARAIVVAAGCLAASLLFVNGFGTGRDLLPRTPIARLTGIGPGGSLSESLSREWHPQPLAPAAGPAEDVIDSAGSEKPLVLLPPATVDEALVRARRSNLLPINATRQEDLARRWNLPRVLEAVNGARSGTRMITSAPSLRGEGLLTLQRQALRALRKRFRLRRRREARAGLLVVALERRRRGRR